MTHPEFNPVRDITDRTAIAEALANTYGGDRPGWERVEEYQRVMEYAAKHPNKKSYALSSSLNLPRSRIRPWVESDAAPDPANAVKVAEDHRWLDLDWEESPFTQLNVLVAWIFAGGSINERFVSAFAIDSSDQREFLEDVFGELGTGHYIRREDEASRATEVIPGSNPSVFGRVLVALGAPRGAKNATADFGLPSYLAEAPRGTRLEFGQTYVWLRGSKTQDRPNWPIVVTEKRSPKFKQELRGFLRSLLEHPEGLSGATESHSFHISPEAAQLLFREPEI